jgi:hypothetical protein
MTVNDIHMPPIVHAEPVVGIGHRRSSARE